MINLQNFFGFNRDPFGTDLKVEELYTLPDLKPLVDRFDYAVAHGLVTVVIGDVEAANPHPYAMRSAGCILPRYGYSLWSPLPEAFWSCTVSCVSPWAWKATPIPVPI